MSQPRQIVDPRKEQGKGCPREKGNGRKDGRNAASDQRGKKSGESLWTGGGWGSDSLYC